MRFCHKSSTLSARKIAILFVITISILGEFFIFCQPLLAMEAATGITAVEEGDDRLRPAATLHLGIRDKVYSRFFYYGRTFGPVTQRTAVLSVNYPFHVIQKSVRAGIGLASLMEQTIIKVPDEPLENEKNYNFGLSIGIQWSPDIAPWFFSVGWESHLFLAGPAGIFLSTGRIEGVSLMTGFRF